VAGSKQLGTGLILNATDEWWS